MGSFCNCYFWRQEQRWVWNIFNYRQINITSAFSGLIFSILIIASFAGLVYICCRFRRAKPTQSFDNLEYTLPRIFARKSGHDQTMELLNANGSISDNCENTAVLSDTEFSSQIANEHLYEEVIKKSDNKYDQLDHFRPSQKIHPNYDHPSSSKPSNSIRQNPFDVRSPSPEVIYVWKFSSI